MLVAQAQQPIDPVSGFIGAVGTLTAAALTLGVAGPVAGGVAIALAAATTALGGWISLRALGGTCGDTYGAVNKLVELAVYAGLASVWG